MASAPAPRRAVVGPPQPPLAQAQGARGAGTVIVRYRASKAYAAHEVQVNVGDPFVEEVI